MKRSSKAPTAQRMPRIRLTDDRVVTEVKAFANEVGPSQLTTCALAARLDVRESSPS